MAGNQRKPSASKSLPTSPMSDDEIGAFLTEVEEARRYRDDLEVVRPGLSPTEVIAQMTSLPRARQRATELERRLQDLRGDVLPDASIPASPATVNVAKADGRMKIQAEAFEYWIRLKAAGANPTIHSICDTLARWCADSGVTTHTGTTPRAGTIRNSILGGSSGWVPPTHSRDEAQEHVARLAQVAQPGPENAK